MIKLELGESQNVEYKESWRDEYLKWICGFANAQGGRLYIGVNDACEIVGVEDSKKLMEDIPNKIVSQLGILCDINLLTGDGLNYIEIIVEPNSVPISYKGKYHYRSGSTKQEINGVALQQFVLKKMGNTWDDYARQNVTVDDIDRVAIEYFLKKGIEAGRIDPDDRNATTRQVLENLNLIDENGNLKNAALLLFAKKPQKYFPCVEFRIGKFGRNEAELIVQDSVEGNLIQMTDKVVKLLKTYYLKSYIHYEGMQRIETLEVPEPALREIIYNAIAHKDYTGVHIQMRIYDNKIELWNDGELPIGYTQETLMRQHSSRPRNKNIAFAFFKAGFVEAWGRGYKKIAEAFENTGLPMPTVRNDCGGTLVTIMRPTESPYKEQNVGSNVGSVSEVQLTERQQRIIKLIRLNPQVSAMQMSEVMSVVKRTVERDLAFLQSHRVIKHEGNTSAGKWIVLLDKQ